ncbi:MAG: hypothetical protein LBI99_07845 [Propionibacteriaceae bacterium]|jgi:hypothetical protein|nr:hypothetical protein [Propionibacteriaceae bacterium]
MSDADRFKELSRKVLGKDQAWQDLLSVGEQFYAMLQQVVQLEADHKELDELGRSLQAGFLVPAHSRVQEFVS